MYVRSSDGFLFEALRIIWQKELVVQVTPAVGPSLLPGD
jgi:hypothetical protein